MLIKCLIAGSTARSAAALTVVNRHTATLYFHKLRELIAEQLDAMAPELLAGEIEVMRAISAACVRASEDVARLARFRCSGS